MRDSEFREYFDNYDKIALIKLIDNAKGFIEYQNRNTIAYAAFDKLTITFISVTKIVFPYKSEIFDISSLSSLSRNIIELSNNLFFFGSESADKEEDSLRFDLFQYLSKKERQQAARKLDVNDKLLSEWELKDSDLIAIKNRIISNPVFVKLILSNKIQGFDSLINDNDRNNKYWSRTDLLKRRNLNLKFMDSLYKLHSIDIHGTPASIDMQIQSYFNKEYLDCNDSKSQVIAIMQSIASIFVNSLFDFSKILPDLTGIITTEEMIFLRNYEYK